MPGRFDHIRKRGSLGTAKAGPDSDDRQANRVEPQDDLPEQSGSRSGQIGSPASNAPAGAGCDLEEALGIAEMRAWSAKQPQFRRASPPMKIGGDPFLALHVSTKALPRSVDDLGSEPTHPVWDASDD